MTEFRYFTTDLITGNVRADWIPLRVGSFGRVLGDAADFTASLDLRTNPVQNAAYVNALEPRKTVLWVAEDTTIVWGGIIWDWPHNSILDYTLPIRASSIESLFAHREIRADQVFAAQDSFDIIRTLLTYATSGPGRGVFGLVAPTTLAADSQTLSWLATDAKKILDVLKEISASANVEFTFDPVIGDDGNAGWRLRLGAPTLGLAAGASNLVLQMPGNVVDYAFPRTGAGSANSIAAVATASSEDGSSADWRSAAPHGIDAGDLAAGYPVLEDTVSYGGTTVTAQTVIDTYADSAVQTRTRTATVPTVTLGGPTAPKARDLTLGSWAWLLATSPLHPADAVTGAPGLQKLVRIVGWTVTPPSDGQEETIVLQLGEVDAT